MKLIILNYFYIKNKKKSQLILDNSEKFNLF